MSEIPEPLVPPEVNLRGLPWMRLDTSRLLDSDLFALSTGDEFKAAVALWCKSWTQEPAGSLPNDDRVLAHLSGAGSKWKRLKAMALRGWITASDGRLYHPVVAEQVLAAWDERQDYRAEVEGRNERKRRERAERAAMFETLKAAGHTLPWNTPTGVLRDLLRDLSQAPDTGTSHACHGDSHGLDGTGRDGTITTPDTSAPADTSSRERAKPEQPRITGEAWDAFEAHQRQRGRWTAARSMLAQGQLRALATTGHDTNAVLTWATLRGLSDLADAARRMAQDAARDAAADRMPGESLADASYRRSRGSESTAPRPVAGALVAALAELAHDGDDRP